VDYSICIAIYRALKERVWNWQILVLCWLGWGGGSISSVARGLAVVIAAPCTSRIDEETREGKAGLDFQVLSLRLAGR